jgi:hypothetical protein
MPHLVTFCCQHGAQRLNKGALAGARGPRETNPEGDDGPAQALGPLHAVGGHQSNQVTSLDGLGPVGGFHQCDRPGQALPFLLRSGFLIDWNLC